MKTSKESGILGYGAYIPKYIVEGEEIARVWGNSKSPIKSKRVPGLDEDTLTMAYEASNIAISSSGVNPENIQSIHAVNDIHTRNQLKSLGISKPITYEL